jgi:hypothetical protein
MPHSLSRASCALASFIALSVTPAVAAPPPMHTTSTYHAAPMRTPTPQPVPVRNMPVHVTPVHVIPPHVTSVHVMTTVRPAALHITARHPAPVHAAIRKAAAHTALTRLANVTLDDGGHAFIGSDHRLYLLAANGAYRPAPGGHYHTDNGACFHFATGEAIDPGTLRAFLGSRSRSG